MQPRRYFVGFATVVAVLVPLATHAELRITEVMYDPEGTDSKKEWIEIFNEGPYLVDLANVKFADKSAHTLNTPPKNGGVGTMVITPGAYAVIASDATTFHTLFPNLPQVIDTTMSLNNTGATIGLGTSQGPLARAVYEKGNGAAGNGESLQWQGGTWIHAQPTPGHENAKASTPPVVAKPVIEKQLPKETVSAAPVKKTTSSASKELQTENDPMYVVNATATDARSAETAAAGTLGASPWWFAAGALGIASGAAAMMISRTKRNEWNIEESE